MGALSIGFALVTRQPITIAWSTPGAALLVATGAPAGGYAVAVGAFLVAGVLIVLAGMFKPFGRAVSAIPLPLARRDAGRRPPVALPCSRARGRRDADAGAAHHRRVGAGAPLCASLRRPHRGGRHRHHGALHRRRCRLARSTISFRRRYSSSPAFTLQAIIGIAVPLFIVTMASQNVPGLAVLAVHGYRPAVGPIFIVTGLGSIVTAFLGGHSVNLAAITAALNASPEAHPDPSRRWIANRGRRRHGHPARIRRELRHGVRDRLTAGPHRSRRWSCPPQHALARRYRRRSLPKTIGSRRSSRSSPRHPASRSSASARPSGASSPAAR